MSRRFVQVFWVMCLGVLACGIYWPVSEWRHARGLQRVRDLMAVYRFAEAREWLSDVPSWRSGRPEESYRLGVCEHAGDIPAALAAWSHAAPDSEWGLRAGLARARTLVGDLGRFTDAEEILVELMAVMPSSPSPLRDEVRASLAELWFWQGRRDEVSRLLESTWKTTTDPVGVLRDRWRAETATTMVEMIRADVERAASKAPDDDRVWLAQASLAFQATRYDEARRWLDRCLERRPEDPAVWMARLALAREVDDLDEVQRAMEVLPADRLTAAERLTLSAWLARHRDDRAAEQDALERLLTLPPADPRTLDRMATLASEAGDPTAAAEYRRRKAALDAAKDRYRFLLNEEIVPERFAELAELAEALDRRFEAECWWTLRLSFAPIDHAAREALVRLREVPEADRPAPGVTLAAWLATEGPPLPDATAIASPGAEPGETVVPWFQDVAAEAGLTFVLENGRSPQRQMPETTSGGVGLLDFDDDGWLDVYVVQGGTFPPDPSLPSESDRLFRNRGDGTFEDVTEASGIARLTRGYGHGVTVGDIDNDGHPDLFLTRWRAYQLLRNNGDGTFEDATEAWGLGGDRDWPTSAAFADLDNDGSLDLYVCHYLEWDAEDPMLCRRATVSDSSELSDPGQLYNYCSPRLFPALHDHLFRNDGERFVDVTEQAGIVDPEGRGLGVVAADVDGDGLVDLYVANDTTADYLWRNLGEFRFEEVAFSSGVACNADGAFQAGMGTACGDLDGDGLPDLLVTNFYGEGTTFFKNLGGGIFGDTSASIGLSSASRYLLGFGIALPDANNDGALDIATANGHVNDDRPDYPYDMPATLLLGNPRGRLIDVTHEVGPSWAEPRVSRGLAVGDLDNDGRVDAVLLPQKSPMAYLHNRTEGGGHFVTFRLIGTRSNRDGIGAVVTVESGGRSQRAWRVGGGSFQSSSDPRLHFGLGERAHLESVEVRWPSGQVDRFTSVEADRAYQLREGAAELPLLGAGWPHRDGSLTEAGLGYDNAAE